MCILIDFNHYTIPIDTFNGISKTNKNTCPKTKNDLDVLLKRRYNLGVRLKEQQPQSLRVKRYTIVYKYTESNNTISCFAHLHGNIEIIY